MDKRRISSTWIIAALCWTAAIVVLMLMLRSHLLESFDKDAASQWQAWRDHVQKQQQEAVPVQRRVPSSELPPAYVLMQDHFPVCLGAAVVFGFLLFAVFSFLIMGVLSDTTVIEDPPENIDSTGELIDGE